MRIVFDRLARGGPDPLGEIAHRQQHRRGGDGHQQRQQPVLGDHHPDQRDEGQHVARDRRDGRVDGPVENHRPDPLREELGVHGPEEGAVGVPQIRQLRVADRPQSALLGERPHAPRRREQRRRPRRQSLLIP